MRTLLIDESYLSMFIENINRKYCGYDNDHKPIDLDYYFWIQAKCNMNIFKKDASEDNMAEHEDKNIADSDMDEILDPAEDQLPF